MEGELDLGDLPSFDFDFEETTNGALPCKMIGDRHPYQSSDGSSHAWNEEEEVDNEEEGEREGCRKHRRKKLDYRSKVLLAPMVRVGLLPFRLLCLSYGADIVYSEEIIDKKLELCKRRLNPELGTVEFFPKGKDPTFRENLVFQTCSKDTPTVLQLGTATSVGALKATEIVYASLFLPFIRCSLLVLTSLCSLSLFSSLLSLSSSLLLHHLSIVESETLMQWMSTWDVQCTSQFKVAWVLLFSPNQTLFTM
jgi:hypothetical protein